MHDDAKNSKPSQVNEGLTSKSSQSVITIRAKKNTPGNHQSLLKAMSHGETRAICFESRR